MRLVGLVLLASVAVLVTGCPKEKRALNAARKAVEVAAQTVDLVDAEVSGLYGEAAAACLTAHETSEGYKACMAKWDKTVRGVVSMKHSLLIVENGLDAWEAGSPNGQNNLLQAAACFVESMQNLSALLSEVGAETPALDTGLDYVENLFSSGLECSIGEAA